MKYSHPDMIQMSPAMQKALDETFAELEKLTPDELWNELMKVVIGQNIGDKCNRDGCTGTMVEYPDTDDACYCHLMAPCGVCEYGHPVNCDECGADSENNQ